MTLTRTLNDCLIFWQDKRDVTHICEGSDVHPGVRLLWTLCERDVPADKAFISSDQVTPTCPKCIAISRGHVWCSRCKEEMEFRSDADCCEDFDCPMVGE